MLERRFLLPPPERPQPWWTIASVVAHVVVLLLIAIGAGKTYLESREPTFIQLLPPEVPDQREFALPPVAAETPRPPASERRTIPLPRVRTVQRADTGRVATIVAPREVPIGVPPSSDSAMVIGTDRTIGPAFAQGRVWVRPLEAELGVVGPSPSVAAHVARVDSALQKRILAFIDSMPRDSFATPRTPPAWTSEIDGQTWGVDSKWIYLGGLKLPTALLALLPFPQGNYDEAKRNQELQRIRSIIIQAESRAENSADFKRYIQEVRERRDAERAAERARRDAARDTVVP